MQCPGLAGLWRTCPDPLVGLQPFERQVLLAVATPLAIVLLVLVLALFTTIVVTLTDGIPLGITRRTVDPHAVRADRLEQARRHLLRTRRTGAFAGRATGPPTSSTPMASAPFAWRPSSEDDRPDLVVAGRRILGIASSRASSASDRGFDVLIRVLDRAAHRLRPPVARATAASASRRWLVPSVAGSIHAAALVAAAASGSGPRPGPDGSSSGPVLTGPPSPLIDGRRASPEGLLLGRSRTRRIHRRGREDRRRSLAAGAESTSWHHPPTARRRAATVPVPAPARPSARPDI